MTPLTQDGFSLSATEDTIGFSSAYSSAYPLSPGNMSTSPYTNIQSSLSPFSYHPQSPSNYGIASLSYLPNSPIYPPTSPRYSSNDIYGSKPPHYR
jgi:hypothetical protein